MNDTTAWPGHDDNLDEVVAATEKFVLNRTLPSQADDPPDRTASPPLLDTTMVRLAYRVIIGEGKDVGVITEVRVLGVRNGSYTTDYFGYFNNSADIVRALDQLPSWSGVYLLLSHADHPKQAV